MSAVAKPKVPQEAPADGEPLSTLYERDYVDWLQKNAALLRAGRLDALDAENLAEELEDMGRSDVRALGSHLTVVMLHLLKWQYQPQARSSSWRGSIYNGRAAIADLLDDSPSLRQRLTGLVTRNYPRARYNAANETGLPEASFPAECPYSIDALLDLAHWPGDS